MILIPFREEKTKKLLSVLLCLLLWIISNALSNKAGSDILNTGL